MAEVLNWRTYVIDVTNEMVDAADGSNVHWHVCVGHETWGKGQTISLDNSATIILFIQPPLPEKKHYIHIHTCNHI